jgi:hypothetical protein
LCRSPWLSFKAPPEILFVEINLSLPSRRPL